MPPVVAAIVGGIAAIGTAASIATGVFLGISTLGWAAISVGVSIGSSLLAPKPKAPRVSPASVDRLRASIDPRTPRKTAVGITALATDIRDEEFNSDQTNLQRFIVCASHEIESIDEVWFDDELAWTNGVGTSAKFGTYLSISAVPLGDTAYNTGPRMGSSRKYTGLANLKISYELDDTRGSPFVKGVTNRITIKGKGAKFYDPRLDSTVTGGAGAHRADNQATWAWDATFCRNPALAILFYLLGWKINGVLVVGKGIPQDRIDLESFITAANICEETVNLDAGGTEQRYRCDGVWSEADSPDTVLGMLKSTCNADLDDVDGKIRITIFEDETGASVADYDDSDLVGGFEWQPYPPLAETFNVVRGTYTDPSNEALFQARDYPEVSVTSPDGIDRIQSLNFPMVQSDTQARRLANLQLQRMANPGTFKCTLQATGWRCQKNSIIRLTFAKRGWTNKVFRVAEYEANVNGTVPVVLREEYASLYVEPASDPAFAAIASTPYDPFADPIVAAVNSTRSAIRNALVKNPRNTSDVARNLLTATDAGASATISVARHDWDYPTGTADVTRELSTITGLSYNTVYYVYFDDADLTDTAPTYAATQTQATGQNTEANPTRHPIGIIRTPAASDPDTTGIEAPVTGGYENDKPYGWQVPLIRAAIIGNPRTAGDVARNLLTATDAGATATISVAKHDWDYPDGTADLTRALGTITGLSFDTVYYVYFDDADLTDAAPTYAATQTQAVGQNSVGNPYRHPLGIIRTPSNGDTDTSEIETPVNGGYENDKPYGWQAPLIRSAIIGDPRNTSDVSRNLLTATDAGATATISVARHDWDYPDGTPDITREEASITGLAFNTVYYVYFDDDTLANGSPAYAASTSIVTGSNRYTTPSRHPIGSIRTPADGDPDTTEEETPIAGGYQNDPAFGWQIPLIRSGLIKNPRTTGDVARALMTATDVGATATISVARHDWDYNNAQPDVTRELATITGLAFDTLFYVYFDDATLANGAPTYVATTIAANSFTSYDQPGRHPVGAIFTPSDGGADTSIIDSAEIVVNYSSSNDNNAASIVAPTMASIPVTHENNANGSANVTFAWAWTGNQADIDGFIVYLYAATPAEAAYSKNLAYDTFGAESLCLVDGGNRMYLGSSTGVIYQYDVYERDNLASSVFVGSKDLSGTITGAISGVTWHPDGTRIWISETTGVGSQGYFHQLDVTTAWDITTVTTTGMETYNPGGGYEDITDLQISNDGEEMIFTYNTASGAFLGRFLLGSNYDFNSPGTLSNRAFSAMTANYQFDTVEGLAINPGGTIINVAGDINGTKRLATLTSVSWGNITSANGNQYYDPAAALHDSDFAGLAISENGRYAMAVDQSNMARVYRLSSAFQISTATAPPNTNGSVGNPYSWGDDPNREVAFTVPSDVTEFTLNGVATDGCYTFGLKAYRRVNTEINSSGIITYPAVSYPAAGGTLVEPTSTYDQYAPYQPNSADEFVGRITGVLFSPSRSEVMTKLSPTTLTPNVETHDVFVAQAIAAGLTIAAPTGQPTGAQTIKIRIVDNGTTRALTWNSAYRAIGVTLPTATTANKTIYVTATWNAVASKWDVTDVKEEA